MQTLQQALLDPASYPDETGPIELIETHISWLFLTRQSVYKIKKPVDFGFCDFSNLDRRRHFCLQELSLNRRLAPETYLDICRIVKTAQSYALGGSGPVCDYAVRMRRLPRTMMLDRRLADGTSAAELKKGITKVAERLANFHDRAVQIDIREHVDAAAFAAAWQQNFEQTSDCPPTLVAPGLRRVLAALVKSWIESHKQLLRLRLQEGFVRDGHGDLHCEHICLSEPLQIIDCIEFNPSLRYGDILNDLAFLVMDLRYRNRPDLARTLWQAYRQKMEVGPRADQLIRIYCLYRAWVRAKIHYFQMGLPAEQEQHRNQSRKYFLLAASFALPQLLLLCCGRIGSGKSTLAQDLGEAMKTDVLGSDRLRPKVFEADQNKRYSMQGRLRVYAEICREAEELLRTGNSLIIDATFESHAMRAQLLELAERLKIPVHFLLTTCTEDLARSRLRAREVTQVDTYGSEAGLAEYDAQHGRFEAFLEGVPLIEVDTGQPRENNVDFVLEQLLQRHGTL